MEQAKIKSFEASRGAEPDKYAGQIKDCPYPPGGCCLLEERLPKELWCTAKRCWLFGQHVREWVDEHPIAHDRINYTDAEMSEMFEYAQRKGEITGAAYGRT
jgi:hypothetical protein